MTEFNEEIIRCIDVLRKGGIIVYPTDTIWGIGCDATNPGAVAAIYALKQRNDSKSMLVLTDSLKSLNNWVSEIPASAMEFIDSDRPTTVIYNRPKGLAANLLAEDGSVGIRITNELFSRELCKRFGKPIVSTSANISGHPAPAHFKDIENEILEKADYTADYRRDDNQPHSPSRIIKILPDGSLTIIRD